MSLKSIRESYSKLLTTFADAGVKLNESQKTDIDDFVLAIESNISEQRKSAIKHTQKLVETKLEKQYKAVFESIMKNMQENAELAAKIQDKVTAINESKKVADKVDAYLNKYVETVLPNKVVVDYDRMQKLERLHESLKDILVVSEDAVASKITELDESYKAKQSKAETEIAKIQAKLNESLAENKALSKKLDTYKTAELLESKTKDLPSYEARQIKKQLKESTPEQAEAKFNETLDKVQKKMEEDAKAQDLTIEAEVKKIIDVDESEEDDVKEDDMLKNRPHNAHIAEVEDDNEVFETTETVKFNENGDVELDESDVIDENMMQMWCGMSIERT